MGRITYSCINSEGNELLLLNTSYAFIGRITYSYIDSEGDEQEEEDGEIVNDSTDGEKHDWDIPYIPVSIEWQRISCSNLGLNYTSIKKNIY